MTLTIIFEDNSFLVINKPSGMVVNRAETTAKMETVQDWIAQNFQFSIFNFQELRNGIVHRLDKETSGILLIAKTVESFENLQAQFKNREVKKKYLALVHGKVLPEEGEINAPVGRLPWNRERFGVMPGGREAVTKYKVIRPLLAAHKQFPAGSNHSPRLDRGSLKDSSEIGERLAAIPNSVFTFLELFPETGRTHQIRVHLQYLGFPIVGDYLYAGRKQAQEDRIFCPRVFLHAAGIKFKHPASGKLMEFEAELPEELKNIINNFKF